MGKKKALKTPPRLTDDEIKSVARDLATGDSLNGNQVPAALIPVVFLPIGLGGLDDYNLDSIGSIVGERQHRMGMGVNGYPTFTACRLIHRDDWPLVMDKARTMIEALS